MITERQEELAALHALGLLEGAERAAFEAELAGNAELAALVDSLAGASANLSFAARQVPPPAGLKERVLAACASVPQSAKAEAALAPVVGFPLRRLIPWAAAAILAVTAGWLASRNLALQSENDFLRTERQLAQVAYLRAQAELKERSIVAEGLINDLGRQLRAQDDLTRLKVTALVALAGGTPEARAIAVWDPGREAGLLTVEKLPAIDENQDYQLWVVDPAYPNPVDGGVFKPGADGRVALTFKGNKPIKSVAAFAISLEKKGGVPKAEGPIVLLGKVPPI
ncbi:MAG TPA: anti-sigma factor [Lacunisphaera sp.]|nr:anti-sigma factor [Lacunisphaera sp.]